MPFDGSAWAESSPTNADLANEIDDNMRDIKTGVRGRMGQEHLWPTAQSATAEGGIHRYVTLVSQTSAPNLVVGTNTQVGCLFVTSAGNVLTFENSAGSSIPLVYQDAKSAFPPGAILPYGGASAPTGFHLCTGGAFSRTTDLALWTAISTAYGSGDGSTTFNVPDLRGRGVMGLNASTTAFAALGTSGGATTINIQHNHGGTTGGVTFGGATGTNSAGEIDTKHYHTIANDLSTTQSILTPYVTVNFIIAR